MLIHKYAINVNVIGGLPRIPFRNGVGAYEGVVLHSTAVYGDSANGERNYETQHWSDAFVHGFVDDTQILQTADFDYIAWHAGHTANQRFLGFELCQTYDRAKFLAAYDRWIWLAALKLYERKLGVVDGVTLLSHAQVSARWHECDHTDPLDYLAYHGKTWANVVSDVTAYYEQMEAEERMLEELQKRVAVLEKALAAQNDQTVSDWAKASVDKAVKAGVIKGDDSGLSPKKPVTREQLVTILDRLGVLK